MHDLGLMSGISSDGAARPSSTPTGVGLLLSLNRGVSHASSLNPRLPFLHPSGMLRIPNADPLHFTPLLIAPAAPAYFFWIHSLPGPSVTFLVKT